MTDGNSRAVIHIVIGPTASGKTAYAVDLAKKLSGVVINSDSMQVYDGLHILTAQPSEEERSGIPHKLFSVLKPHDACSAGKWREMAEPVIREVLAEGKTPIIAGGTGLYVKALMEGLSPIPKTDPAIRERLNKKQAELGNPAIHEELKKLDPVMAARLDPNDTQRMLRALEVLEGTGKSLAEWQKESRLAPPQEWNFEVHKILPERAVLHERINARFLSMMKNGALEEVKNFSDKIDAGEVPADTPLLIAHGFRYLRSHLKGKRSLEEAIDLSQTETRQYAKRQTTWIRHQL